MKYFDKNNSRLVFQEARSDPDFWDKLWRSDDLKKEILKGKKDRFVSRITKKFIPPSRSNRIIEGGCGKGQFVYSLSLCGYDAYGVDYAKKTIEKINLTMPDLKISCQDVRKMNFPDNFFDGYWSLGVIEHFYEGYDKIVKEAKRVIKPGGYLFLTFPYMSPLRKIKAKLGLYPVFDKNKFQTDFFYQFALNHKNVTAHFARSGFTLIEKMPLDGIKGLKDEIVVFKPVLQKIYGRDKFVLKVISKMISLVFSNVSGHSMLIILKKR
ncbi:MAG: class I SAM-dependent methyltransferase [Candidatus Moranbacteria bacterium]|nr:class I SAM-dependent methyltransferase [Candidatus Moranbacteria bacterium]